MDIKCIKSKLKVTESMCTNPSGVGLILGFFPYQVRCYDNINYKPDPGLIKLIQWNDNQKIAK